MSKQRSEEIHGLDPGIAPVVKYLMHKGIRTFESCEGGSGHAYSLPMVKFHVDDLLVVQKLLAAVGCVEYRIRLVRETQFGGIEVGQKDYGQIEFFSEDNLRNFIKQWSLSESMVVIIG